MITLGTNVFISSVWERLEETRNQIGNFLRDMGHTPIQFESADFAKMQNPNMVETCLRKVEDCHIFILIIGEEARTIVEEFGKSVTLLELRKAISTNRTIMVFAKRYVLEFYMNSFRGALRSMQTANPTVSFDEMFDSLGHVGVKREVLHILHDAFQHVPWVFKFDNVDEIKRDVLAEFSSLLEEHIELRNQNQITALSDLVHHAKRFSQFDTFLGRVKPLIHGITYRDIARILRCVQSSLKGGTVYLDEGAGIPTPMVDVGNCEATSLYKSDVGSDPLRLVSSSGLASDCGPFDLNDSDSFVATTYRGPQPQVFEDDGKFYVRHIFRKYVFAVHFPIEDSYMGMSVLVDRTNDLYSGIMKLHANLDIVNFFSLFLLEGGQ